MHLLLEYFKKNLGKGFEHFKRCNVAKKSYFILRTEFLGSHYEKLLRIVKSYIINMWEQRKSKLYGSDTDPLQYRSQPGRDIVCQGKGKFNLVGWEGGSHAVLFTVLLSLPVH